MRPYPEIEMADDEGVRQTQPVAEAFMRTILGLEPGDYLITDESRLTDFALDARSAQDLVGRVMDTYQLALVPNNLLQLLRELMRSRQQY